MEGGRKEREGERRGREKGEGGRKEMEWRERGRRRSWPLTLPGAIPCLWPAPTDLCRPRLRPRCATSCPHHPSSSLIFVLNVLVDLCPRRLLQSLFLSSLFSLFSSLLLFWLSSLLCGVWWWERWGWWGTMVVAEQPV